MKGMKISCGCSRFHKKKCVCAQVSVSGPSINTHTHTHQCVGAFGSLRFVPRARRTAREIRASSVAPPLLDQSMMGKLKHHNITHTQTHTNPTRTTTHPPASHVHAGNSCRAKTADMFSPCWSELESEWRDDDGEEEGGTWTLWMQLV